MIYIKDRVALMAQYIEPSWTVIDFGCGDGYLASLRPNQRIIGIGLPCDSGADIVIDLDQYDYSGIAGINADCAFVSGVLEWLDNADYFLEFILSSYDNVIMSYAKDKRDSNWRYKLTFNEILIGIIRHKMKIVHTQDYKFQQVYILKRDGHSCV